MNAIVFTSNTGSTEQYAKLLSEETGIPAYPLSDSAKNVPIGSEVIYLGWIMAGSVKGYHDAAKRYRISAVCAVGMGRTGTQTENVRSKTGIPAAVPIFTLQGNFNVKRLHGVCRMMMEIMVKTVGKQLSDKPDRTPDEDDMLDMMLGSGERVNAANLNAVLEWCKGNEVKKS